MSAKHSNPKKPREDKDHNKIWARAPYNFVPLPEKMVPARTLLPQDQYHQGDDGLTGWIECEIETCTPTYIRGLLHEVQFKEQGRKKPADLKPEEKLARSAFFGVQTLEGELRPVIPGSTLRGMIRALVEVAGYGRVRWVSKEPTFTFRAVAAPNEDPLKEPYQKVLGKYGGNVKAGYLILEGEKWFIQPARTPKQVGVEGVKDAVVKIEDEDIDPSNLPGFLNIDDKDYRPQIHAVSFARGERKPKRKKPHETRPSWIVGTPDAKHQHQGMLVCSGNMKETGEKTERCKHVIVMPADPDPKKRISIPEQVIKDYRAGLTPYQRENLTAWAGGDWGCLGAGKPVFYVAFNGKVAVFGHSMNFRIPARLAGEDRAATPLDFVPEALRNDPSPDLADAIFGWVEEDDYGPKFDRPQEKQRAGRVFFEDAHFEGAVGPLWYRKGPIIPRVLAGPKATTFQHYLVQDRDWEHEPDEKVKLAHYGTPSAETQIRGYKFYWFKGENPPIVHPEAGDPREEQEHESQLTRIQPLNAGVRFRSKIHFENLRPEELGALLWALTLPGEPGKTYRHRLGMGKPLGIGGVALQPTLYLSARRERYQSLFAAPEEGGGQTRAWNRAERETALEDYIKAFQGYILQTHGVAPGKTRLAEVPRIAALLLLHEWRADDPNWQDWTRYMEIERGTAKINEYKERPVLPDPQGVVDLAAGGVPHQREADPAVVRAAVTQKQQPPKKAQSRPPQTEPETAPRPKSSQVKRKHIFTDNSLPPIPDVPEEASDAAKDILAGLFGKQGDDEK